MGLSGEVTVGLTAHRAPLVAQPLQYGGCKPSVPRWELLTRPWTVSGPELLSVNLGVS